MHLAIYFGTTIWEIFFEIDKAIATVAHALACRLCNGKLSWNNYQRKPRGIPVEAEKFCNFRFSLCCSSVGCRKRTTPPTVRFLGRKVYVAVFIIFIFLYEAREMHQKIIELPPQSFAKETFKRWFMWWSFVIPNSPVWKKIVGFLPANVENQFIPIFLMEEFNKKYITLDEAIPPMLELISPISVPSDYPSFNQPILWNKKIAQKMQLQKIDNPTYIKRSD